MNHVKTLALLLLLLCAFGANALAQQIPQYEGYTLLWNDEFDGDTLNTKNWNMDRRQPGWANNELQEYRASEENVFLRDGRLVLKAIRTQTEAGADYYTSGKVSTRMKHDFTYGRIVVGAKTPEGQGLWPAIWMMPTDEGVYGSWPKCGEIDIMEVLCNDVKTAHGTIHYGDPHAQQQGTYVLSQGSFAEDFHEFCLEWEPGEMRWYIDGELFHQVNDWYTAVEGQKERPYPAPFNRNFYLQMNLAVGGDWPGNPDETTDFDRAEYEIDYVRVYQKTQYDLNVTKPEKEYRDALADGNLVYNGSFEEEENLADDENWTFYLASGGKGEAQITDGMIVITSQAEGSEDYSVQLFQPKLAMVQGKRYRITFDAWAQEDRDIIVCISAPTAGWIRYFPDTVLGVTGERTTYTYEFEMTERDDNNGRIEFNLGHRGSTATVYLTNVRVEEAR